MQRTIALLVVAALLVPCTTLPAESQAGPPAPPVAVGGDLAHLVYTARTGLIAHAVSPDDGGVVNATATSFVVATVDGAGVELRVNSVVIPSKSIGRRAVLANGTVRYTYYGVKLAAGSNLVELTPLGADGLRGPTVVEHVWGPGAPAALLMTGCVHPRADGRTSCPLRIAVLDAWHHPAAPGSTLKVAVTEGNAKIGTIGIVGGDPVLESISGAEPALERSSLSVVLSGGSNATLPIVPGTLPGRIRISAGIGTLSSELQFDTVAFARSPFVTGLATVGIGAVPGDVGSDPTAADGTNSRLGRIALYGTGTVGGNAVGSLAYDTAGSLAPTTSSGTLNDDPNDRPYGTYGDASTRRNDALTQSRLFARVDDGYNNLLWGEYTATTAPQGTAGAVNLEVNGARAVVGSAATTLGAFTAVNDVGYGRQVLAPTGLAFLTSLAHDNLIVGSEVVTLVSRNRLTGVIVSQTVFQDVVDYTIDYTSGIIHFINVPLPYDSAFNPQHILVTYEYSVIAGSAETSGGRFDTQTGRGGAVKVGAGYVNDASGVSDFHSLSQYISGPLPGGSWNISHAQSDGFIPGAGAANEPVGDTAGAELRFAAASTGGPYTWSVGYDATTQGYANPFGDLQTPGLMDARVSIERALNAQSGTVSMSYDGERTTGFDGGLATATESNLAVALHEKVGSRVAVQAGVTFHQSQTPQGGSLTAPSPTPTSSSIPAPSASTAATAALAASVTQADLGVDWRIAPRVDLGVERDQDIGGSDATAPAQTTAKLSYRLSNTGRIFIEELLSDSPARGLTGTNVGAPATHAFEFGMEDRVAENTSIESTYAVSGTGNSTDVSSALGVKQQLAFSKQVRGDAFVQRGVGNGTTPNDFFVYGLSLAYGDTAGRLRATGSLQDRTGTNTGLTWSLGLAGKISNDISLLASDAVSNSAENSTVDSRIALAWRPSTSDRGAILAGYERSTGNAIGSGTQSGVASLDGLYRPTHRLEVTARYARKIDGDSVYLAGTSLIGLGLRQQIGPRFDFGVETRSILAQSTAGGLHSTALEAGAYLGNTLRGALGYNFGVTADSTLAAAPTRKGVYATLTTTIDRIFGWGAH